MEPSAEGTPQAVGDPSARRANIRLAQTQAPLAVTAPSEDNTIGSYAIPGVQHGPYKKNSKTQGR